MPTYVGGSILGAVTASDCVPSLPAGTLPSDHLVLFVFTTVGNLPTSEVNGWTLCESASHPFTFDFALSIFAGTASDVGAYTATTNASFLVTVRDGVAVPGAGGASWGEVPFGVPERSIARAPAGLVIGAFLRRNTGTLVLTAENDGTHLGLFPDYGAGSNRGAWWLMDMDGGSGNWLSPSYQHNATPNTVFNSQFIYGWARLERARRRGGRHLGLVRGSRGVG